MLNFRYLLILCTLVTFLPACYNRKKLKPLTEVAAHYSKTKNQVTVHAKVLDAVECKELFGTPEFDKLAKPLIPLQVTIDNRGAESYVLNVKNSFNVPLYAYNNVYRTLRYSPAKWGLSVAAVGAVPFTAGLTFCVYNSFVAASITAFEVLLISCYVLAPAFTWCITMPFLTIPVLYFLNVPLKYNLQHNMFIKNLNIVPKTQANGVIFIQQDKFSMPLSCTLYNPNGNLVFENIVTPSAKELHG